MVKKILGVLLLLILGFVGFVATRPGSYHVERSTSIAAPPEIVYAQLADFHAWSAWSPWEHLDPQMQRTYDGAPSGVGAVYQWSGNDKVGEGKMTITDAQPAQNVGIKLDFIKPWQSTCMTGFALTPGADGTQVTWSVDGKYNFVEKAMCVFMSMDKMMGADFEKGLASLKSTAETEAAKPAEPPASDATSTAQTAVPEGTPGNH